MSEVENSRLDEQKEVEPELAVVGETVAKEDEETAEDIIEQMTLEENQEPILEPQEIEEPEPQEKEPDPPIEPEDHRPEPEVASPKPEVSPAEPEVSPAEPEVPVFEPEPSPEPVDPLSIENENKKELELMNDISTLQTDLKEAATKVNSLQQQLHAMEKYKQVADSFMSISEGASDPAVWYRSGDTFWHFLHKHWFDL